MAEHLALASLSKQFGAGGAAVRDVTLSVPRGAFVTLLGPSGCGKTTTLRMIAGLTQPSGGRILVDGADVTDLPAHRRNMGLVFQSYALFPHMDVARNVAFGLRMRGIHGAEASSQVRDALAMVRLDHFASRRPRELSGGQQQRVALARALVIRPSLLLLDEPLSNLDAKLREELRDEIRAIQTRLGITTVFVTHDQAEALTMSDLVVVMRDGGVEQAGTPKEIYERPASPFVATFIGRMNQLGGMIGADGALEAPGLRLRGVPALPPGSAAIAMVRPHRILLGSGGGNEVAAVVRRAVFSGDTVEYHLEAAGATLVVEQPTRGAGTPSLQSGDAVAASWDPADTLLFPA